MLGHLLYPREAALSILCTHAPTLRRSSHCSGLINALDPQPCCACTCVCLCARDLCIVRTSSPRARRARHRRACVMSLYQGQLLYRASFSPCSPCSTYVLFPCAQVRARAHVVASESTPDLASVCTYVLFACSATHTCHSLSVCSGTFCCTSITSASAFRIATTPRVGEPPCIATTHAIHAQ
jgi:hypothetical protein